ncbi:hypothetical protein [Streptacidiphilus melanogenes]|nr:hypothetical protein [Streptacidiphilus melanogenes]
MTGTTTGAAKVTASRRVEAPPAVVFRPLTDRTRHLDTLKRLAALCVPA